MPKRRRTEPSATSSTLGGARRGMNVSSNMTSQPRPPSTNPRGKGRKRKVRERRKERRRRNVQRKKRK